MIFKMDESTYYSSSWDMKHFYFLWHSYHGIHKGYLLEREHYVELYWNAIERIESFIMIYKDPTFSLLADTLKLTICYTIHRHMSLLYEYEMILGMDPEDLFKSVWSYQAALEDYLEKELPVMNTRPSFKRLFYEKFFASSWEDIAVQNKVDSESGGEVSKGRMF